MGKTYADNLCALNAPAAVRDALATLPSAFAEAFAEDARRLVEAGCVPALPARCAPLPVPFSPRALPGWARGCVLTANDIRGYRNWEIQPLAAARRKAVLALMCHKAGPLLAFCRGFLIVRAAWEDANRRPLVPGGDDWPPLAGEPFQECAP